MNSHRADAKNVKMRKDIRTRSVRFMFGYRMFFFLLLLSFFRDCRKRRKILMANLARHCRNVILFGRVLRTRSIRTESASLNVTANCCIPCFSGDYNKSRTSTSLFPGVAFIASLPPPPFSLFDIKA